LLEHPLVQARLRHPADLCAQHPETRLQRDLFDVGYIADWLEPTMAYGPPEVARDCGRASGRLAGQAFEVVENGTLRCPAGKTLRPKERRKEADGSLRVVYRARKEDCRTCPFACDCLGQHASGDQPHRASTVRRRIAQLGSGCAALAHETTPADGFPEEREVVWYDVPASRIRRTYVAQLRRQQVTIVALPCASGAPRDTEAARLLTRAQRAHRRLSWAARLVRNGCDAGISRYACTVFGVPPTLAAFLYLSPDPS
jgi:hypothetical protein